MVRRSEMFLLLYRQKDIDKIIEGNYQNYVIDKLLVSLCKRNLAGPSCTFITLASGIFCSETVMSI